MSIIHDALKKVQQTNRVEAPTPPPSPPPAPESVHQPQPAGDKDKISIPLLIAVICAVIAMIFAALPQFMPRKNLSRPAPENMPAQPRVTTRPAPEPVMTATPSSDAMSKAIADAMSAPAMPAPMPPATPKAFDPNDPISSIQIEGVMEQDGKKVALINGNVYEEGQTIYNRIISEITFDSLTVMENGQKRTVPITVKP